MSKVYPFGENAPVKGCTVHLIEPINRSEPRPTHRFYAITSAGPVGFAKTSDAKTRDSLRRVSKRLQSDSQPWSVGSRTVRGRKGKSVQLKPGRHALGFVGYTV